MWSIKSKKILSWLYRDSVPAPCVIVASRHKELHLHYDHSQHVSGDPNSLCGQGEVQVGEGGEPGRSEHAHQDQ